jgi:UDP:flavonoid glycosyltransferase YjiC (YdhE family)
VLRAAAAGVPAVIVPATRPQTAWAEFVEDRETGVTLKPKKLTEADKLRDALAAARVDAVVRSTAALRASIIEEEGLGCRAAADAVVAELAALSRRNVEARNATP